MKKLLASLLTLALLLSACGAALAEMALPLVTEPTSFTIMVRQNANDIGGSDYNLKKCCQVAEAETGIHIDWMTFTGDAYKEKVPLMISTGELPDAFSGGYFDVQANYDVLVDLAPYIDTVMPTYKAYLDENPSIRRDMTMTDGGIYALPVGDSSFHEFTGNGWMYMNDTFRNELCGGKMPASLDEFEAYLQTAKDNGYLPLYTASSSYNGLDQILCYYGIGVASTYATYTDYEQSSIAFMGNSAAYREALERLHTWYENGYINADYFTLDNGTFLAKNFDNEKVAFVITWAPDHNFANGLTDWEPVFFMENGEYKNTFVASSAFCGQVEGFCITEACKNPELLCQYVEYIHHDMDTLLLWAYGEQGKIWDYTEDGHYVAYLMGEAKESGLSYAKWRQTYSAHQWGIKYTGIWQDMMTYSAEELVKGGSRNYYVNQINNTVTNENTLLTVRFGGYWDEDKTNDLKEREEAINTFCDNFRANAVVHGFTDAEWDAYCKDLTSKLHVEEYEAMWNEYLHRND